jgi:hypothetical protein
VEPNATNSDKHDDDPLRQLEDWGRKVERRLGRARTGRRIMNGLTWPARAVARRPRRWIAVLLVIAVGGGLWLGRGALLNWSGPRPFGADGGRAYPTASHPAGAYATSSATADPAGPFAGTPAAHWAEGEAGISIPTATAVKGFTTAEVADHLAVVKRALVAARLDHTMLVNHDPSVFVRLVSPANRTFFMDEFRAGHLITMVTVIDANARLSSHPPRVSGRTSFSSTKDDAGRTVLEVVTNYVWAYGFDNDEVSLIHDEVRWRFYRAHEVKDSDLGLRLGGHDGYLANVDCAAAHRGQLGPPTPVTSALGAPDPENPDNYYDPDHALEITDTCGPTVSATA